MPTYQMGSTFRSCLSYHGRGFRFLEYLEFMVDGFVSGCSAGLTSSGILFKYGFHLLWVILGFKILQDKGRTSVFARDPQIRGHVSMPIAQIGNYCFCLELTLIWSRRRQWRGSTIASDFVPFDFAVDITCHKVVPLSSLCRTHSVWGHSRSRRGAPSRRLKWRLEVFLLLTLFVGVTEKL